MRMRIFFFEWLSEEPVRQREYLYELFYRQAGILHREKPNLAAGAIEFFGFTAHGRGDCSGVCNRRVDEWQHGGFSLIGWTGRPRSHQ